MRRAGMAVAHMKMRPDGLNKGGLEERSAWLGSARAHPFLDIPRTGNGRSSRIAGKELNMLTANLRLPGNAFIRTQRTSDGWTRVLTDKKERRHAAPFIFLSLCLVQRATARTLRLRRKRDDRHRRHRPVFSCQTVSAVAPTISTWSACPPCR